MLGQTLKNGVLENHPSQVIKSGFCLMYLNCGVSCVYHIHQGQQVQLPSTTNKKKCCKNSPTCKIFIRFHTLVIPKIILTQHVITTTAMCTERKKKLVFINPLNESCKAKYF